MGMGRDAEEEEGARRGVTVETEGMRGSESRAVRALDEEDLVGLRDDMTEGGREGEGRWRSREDKEGRTVARLRTVSKVMEALRRVGRHRRVRRGEGR